MGQLCVLLSGDLQTWMVEAGSGVGVVLPVLCDLGQAVSEL